MNKKQILEEITDEFEHIIDHQATTYLELNPEKLAAFLEGITKCKNGCEDCRNPYEPCNCECHL